MTGSSNSPKGRPWASLVVGALRFTPGGIPAAWGFHFVWITQVLCGASLSLQEIDVPGESFTASGSTILSGGAFGPEAGIGATIATIAVLVFLFFSFRRHGTGLDQSPAEPISKR